MLCRPAAGFRRATAALQLLFIVALVAVAQRWPPPFAVAPPQQRPSMILKDKSTVDARPLNSIPPLSQSRREDMACGVLYTKSTSCAPRSVSGACSTRNGRLHKLLANFINQFSVSTRRRTNLELFDKLIQWISVRTQAKSLKSSALTMLSIQRRSSQRNFTLR